MTGTAGNRCEALLPACRVFLRPGGGCVGLSSRGGLLSLLRPAPRIEGARKLRAACLGRAVSFKLSMEPTGGSISHACLARRDSLTRLA